MWHEDQRRITESRENRTVQWERSGDIQRWDCSVTITSGWHFSTANLRQGSRHGRFPSHAVANENAFLDAQLSKEMFQIFGHRFIGQHRAVRAVAMVTGIHSQHLTGQRIVRALGMEGQRQKNCKLYPFLAPAQASEYKQRLYCALKCWVSSERQRLSINIYYKRMGCWRVVLNDWHHTGWLHVPMPAFAWEVISDCWEQTQTHNHVLFLM